LGIDYRYSLIPLLPAYRNMNTQSKQPFMQKHLLYFGLLLVCMVGSSLRLLSQAQTSEIKFWTDYTGELGQKKVQLSVFTTTDGHTIGNFRYIGKPDSVYQLKGQQRDNDFLLQAATPAGAFAGTLQLQKTPDNFNGVFTDENNQKTTVRLQLKTMVGGTATQRYLELFGTTETVEAFATAIKNAMLSQNLEWLAAQCRYPITINYAGKKKTIAKNKKEFVLQAKKQFVVGYRNRFKNINCYNMFSNHSGAMMGNGEIWMNQMPGSEKENYSYCITSFNIF
jgi:hypothetical protein